jgi:hypothetical protein
MMLFMDQVSNILGMGKIDTGLAQEAESSVMRRIRSNNF